MSGRNREHERALEAYGCVEEVVNSGHEVPDKYRTLVLSAGALIHSAGLIQAMTFYLSKDKEHHRMLAKHIFARIFPGKPGPLQTLHKTLLELSEDEIMYRTMDVKAFIGWLKGFIEQRIKGATRTSGTMQPDAPLEGDQKTEREGTL